MNCLLIAISLLTVYLAQAHDINKRSFFSWKSSAEPEPLPTSQYLPILKIHKYNGVQIDPIQGPSVYLPNGFPPNSLDTSNINADQLQQLDLINRLANFLPEENDLQEYDFSAILPYVELIPDDSLERIQYSLEASNTKEKSKILKFISFVKYLKEKKLKPFKYIANLGSKIVNNKKDKLAWLFGKTSTTTTPVPFITEAPPSINYPYNQFNYDFQSKLTSPQIGPYYPSFQKFPEAPQLQSNYQPEESNQYSTQPAKIPSSESIKYPFPGPSFQAPYHQFQANYQPQFFPNQWQFSTPAPLLETPKFTPPALPSKNENSNPTYDYKQPPANTYQTFNKEEIYDTAFRNKNVNSLTYPLSSNDQTNSIDYSSAKFSPNIQYTVSYPTPSSDLTASGSENVENIKEKKIENPPETKDILKTENALTSTETSTVSKSSQRRTKLRLVPTKQPINMDELKGENNLGEKSTSSQLE